MPLTPRIPDAFFQRTAVQDGRWRWPLYRDALGLERASIADPSGRGFPLSDPLPALWSASFIEWRYYAVLSDGFQGIVGMALVNPGHHSTANNPIGCRPFWPRCWVRSACRAVVWVMAMAQLVVLESH